MADEDFDLEAALRAIGQTTESFQGHMAELDACFQMAQKYSIALLEQAASLGLSPVQVLLAQYQLARFQVKCNMAEGALGPGDIRGSKAAMEILRQVRHPDGEYPVLELKEGKLEPSGSHRHIP